MKLVGYQGNIFRQSREERDQSIRLAGSSLGSRAHICGFFSSPEDEHQILLPFIQEGLELGEKAVHTVDPRRRDDHLRRLRSAGIDVDALQVNGQFELRDWNNTQLREERFDGARNARSMGRNREIRKAVSPASVVEANFKLYRHSTAVTQYKNYPGRTHYTLGQDGWEELADYALSWAETHATNRSVSMGQSS